MKGNAMKILNRITEAFTDTRRTSLAEKLTAEQSALEAIDAEWRRLCLAAEEGSDIAGKQRDALRPKREAKQARVKELQDAMAAHDARLLDEGTKTQALAREQFVASGKAALGELSTLAAEVDEITTDLA